MPVPTIGTVPDNAKQIYELLTAGGLNANAAAGILGNIEQESGGDPQAGTYPSSYGLIQWTPATHWGVPNNSDVATQVKFIFEYIKANGSVAAINQAATDPASAALYFSNNYERPNAALANNANREASANAVAQAAKSGKWPSGTATTTDSSILPSGGGWLGFLGDPISAATDMLKIVEFLINPLSWLRIIAGFAGFLLLGAGLFMMAKAA